MNNIRKHHKRFPCYTISYGAMLHENVNNLLLADVACDVASKMERSLKTLDMNRVRK